MAETSGSRNFWRKYSTRGRRVLVGLACFCGTVGLTTLAVTVVEGGSSATGASSPPASKNAAQIQVPRGVDPTPTVVADWSGDSVAIDHTGTYDWKSPVLPIDRMPAAFAIAYRVEGNGTATLIDAVVKPVDATVGEAAPVAIGAPAQLSAQIEATFTVTSFSGSPSFVLVTAQAKV